MALHQLFFAYDLLIRLLHRNYGASVDPTPLSRDMKVCCSQAA